MRRWHLRCDYSLSIAWLRTYSMSFALFVPHSLSLVYWELNGLKSDEIIYC